MANKNPRNWPNLQASKEKASEEKAPPGNFQLLESLGVKVNMNLPAGKVKTKPRKTKKESELDEYLTKLLDPIIKNKPKPHMREKPFFSGLTVNHDFPLCWTDGPFLKEDSDTEPKPKKRREETESANKNPCNWPNLQASKEKASEEKAPPGNFQLLESLGVKVNLNLPAGKVKTKPTKSKNESELDERLKKLFDPIIKKKPKPHMREKLK